MSEWTRGSCAFARTGLIWSPVRCRFLVAVSNVAHRGRNSSCDIHLLRIRRGDPRRGLLEAGAAGFRSRDKALRTGRVIR
jgi:hypothetical protein